MKAYTECLAKSAMMMVAVFGCAAGLAACSVKAEAPPNPFGNNSGSTVTPAQPASKAMGADGVWASNCAYDQGSYMRQTMTLRDNSLKIQIQAFWSSNCAGTPEFTVDVDGTMLYYGKSFFVTNGHDVEVTMVGDDGKAQVTRVVFLVENGFLYTSKQDETSTSWPIAVDRTRAYTRIAE